MAIDIHAKQRNRVAKEAAAAARESAKSKPSEPPERVSDWCSLKDIEKAVSELYPYLEAGFSHSAVYKRIQRGIYQEGFHYLRHGGKLIIVSPSRIVERPSG